MKIMNGGTVLLKLHYSAVIKQSCPGTSVSFKMCLYWKCDLQ